MTITKEQFETLQFYCRMFNHHRQQDLDNIYKYSEMALTKEQIAYKLGELAGDFRRHEEGFEELLNNIKETNNNELPTKI
jgi:hypothetical protein